MTFVKPHRARHLPCGLEPRRRIPSFAIADDEVTRSVLPRDESPVGARRLGSMGRSGEYHSCPTRVLNGTGQMSVIRLELHENLAELLGSSPEQIERSALEMIVLELYRRHEISVGRAAALLGLDLLAFIRWSGSLGIPYFDMTPEEWQQELRAIRKA
jgi:hypothetical protein